VHDLHVSFWREDGSWTEPLNLGEGVNSSSAEVRPYVSPDGRYLFFTSNRPVGSAPDRITKWMRV
jgi:hypothetical protein